MERVLLIAQLIYYCVAIVGIALAAIHYVRFLKDRTLANIFSLNEYLTSTRRSYYKSRKIGGETPIWIVAEHINALKFYCKLCNYNLLSGKQKKLHKKTVSNDIVLAVKRHPKRFKKGGKQVIKFISNNKGLFDDFNATISIIEDSKSVSKQEE